MLFDLRRVGQVLHLAREVDQLLSERKMRKLLRSNDWPDNLIKSVMAAWTYFSSQPSDQERILRDLSGDERQIAIASMIVMINSAFANQDIAEAAIRNRAAREDFLEELAQLAPFADSFVREARATSQSDSPDTEVERAENLGLWLAAASKAAFDDPDWTRDTLSKIWAEVVKLHVATENEDLRTALNALLGAVNNLRTGIDLTLEGELESRSYVEAFAEDIANWGNQIRSVKGDT